MRRALCASRSLFTARRLAEVCFDVAIVDDFAGMMVLHVTGRGAWELFRHESGGHRWQRVPIGSGGGLAIARTSSPMPRRSMVLSASHS